MYKNHLGGIVHESYLKVTFLARPARYLEDPLHVLHVSILKFLNEDAAQLGTNRLAVSAMLGCFFVAVCPLSAM